MADSLVTESKDSDMVKLLSRVDTLGYDQHGAMLGEVFLNGPTKEQFEINLPGIRQRRWGTLSIPQLQKSGSIIGVCADGTVLNIGGFSCTDGLKQ